MPSSLAQIQEKVGPAPKPEDVKAPIIVHPYFKAGLDAGARHYDGSVHDMPLRHTTSGVQNHPRPDTRGSTTVPCTSRPPAPAGSPAPAGPGRSFCQFLEQIQVMTRSAPKPGAHLVHGWIRRRCPSHPPLKPIQHRARRFAQGEGVILQALAGEGAGGAGQLPGIGDQQESPAMRLGATPNCRHIGRQRGVAAELGGSQPLSRAVAGGGRCASRSSVEWPSRRPVACLRCDNGPHPIDPYRR